MALQSSSRNTNLYTLTDNNKKLMKTGDPERQNKTKSKREKKNFLDPGNWEMIDFIGFRSYA